MLLRKTYPQFWQAQRGQARRAYTERLMAIHTRCTLVALLAALALSASAVPQSHCPFNILITSVAPHEVAGYKWGHAIRPRGDACVSHIVVEPLNASAWYVGGQYGLYVTKNAGETWMKRLDGQVTALLFARDGETQVIYAALQKKLYRSTTSGLTWTLIRTFDHGVSSLLVFRNKLYAGMASSTHAAAGGVWAGNLDGTSMVFKPFGPGHTGLIVWTLSGHPASGAMYAATEIFDHPTPYKPPFFRTLDGGNTWTNVAGTLPHHVVDTAVRPLDGYVYALTEGLGTYGSADQGNVWTPPVTTSSIGVELLMDPRSPRRLYAGRAKTPSHKGGLFLSTDAGRTYTLVGLEDVTVAGIAMNRTGSRIFVAAYGSGVYVGTVP